MLLERLLAALQQRRCTSVIAYALAQNRPCSNLALSLGCAKDRMIAES
jgi:hypothetical protein